MKPIVQTILQTLAKIYLWRYKPRIIGITGSVGKTSTKEAIAAVLKKNFLVRASQGNLNNELGLPLSILGDWGEEYYQKGSSPGFWLRVVFASIGKIFFDPHTPEFLVLEYAADQPGDIKRLITIFPPQIAVVTAIGDVPVHVEYYTDPDHVAREKSELVQALPLGGHAILNADDFLVLSMREKTKGQVTTFGFNESADVRVSNYDLTTDDNGGVEGVAFKLHYDGSFVPVKIYGSLGRSQATATAAAAAVAFTLDLHLVDISSALATYQGPAGRMKLLKGIKGSLIIDDTYNASPSAMEVALEALQQVSGKRKIAILGDMLELGKYSYDAHQTVGNFAGSVANVLVTVGDKGKVIADAAGNQMSPGTIFTFETSDDAKHKVQELLEPGDVVLVKGSQGKRMEKITKEIMAEPNRASELLVRQSATWLKK